LVVRFDSLLADEKSGGLATSQHGMDENSGGHGALVKPPPSTGLLRGFNTGGTSLDGYSFQREQNKMLERAK
jgi:hypothetical protein